MMILIIDDYANIISLGNILSIHLRIFSRLEDYMKASNERSHREMAKKYYSLERKAWLIAIVLLLLQFLFK